MAVLTATLLVLASFSEPDPETAALAALVGVDAVQLEGAVATTRSTPRVYLQHEGLLSPPVPSVAPARATGYGKWTALAACESSGNWRANTGNGYFGGVQADMTFWRRYGGMAYAPRPDLASPEQQIIVAERGLAVQGPRAWPVCSRRLGWR